MSPGLGDVYKRQIQDAPSIIILNHGEDEARSALAKRLEAVRDWQVLRTAGEERVEL